MDRGVQGRADVPVEFRLCGAIDGVCVARQRGVAGWQEDRMGREEVAREELSRGGPVHPARVSQGLGVEGMKHKGRRRISVKSKAMKTMSRRKLMKSAAGAAMAAAVMPR